MIRRIFMSAGVLALTCTYVIRAAGNGTCEIGSNDWSRGPQEQTVKSGIYSKEQAERGKAVYDKICVACHTFKPSEKSKDNPDLGGDAFLTKWDQKTLHELATVIYTTMPNDGSAVIDEAQTMDVVAYILQQNNFPAGAQPFKWDATARKIMIVK
jgi:mono/diheme cytochrome c family protein